MGYFGFRSQFSKHVLTLASGAVLSCIIPVALSPVLSRLYEPKEFGLFALYISIFGILGAIANARFDLAIVLTSSKEEATQLTVWSIIVALLFATALLILTIFIRICAPEFFHHLGLGYWTFLIPTSVFVYGCYQAMTYWCNRNELFKVLSKFRVLQAMIVGALSVLLGVLQLNEGGLIIGWFVGQAIVAAILLGFLLADIWKLKKPQLVTFSELKKAAVRYKDFAFKGTPATLLCACTNQSLMLLSNLYFGPLYAGYLIFLDKMFGVYTVVIGRNVGDVFYQRVAQDRRALSLSHVLGLAVRLFGIGLLAHAALYLFFLYFFTNVFGIDWAVAATIGRILIFPAFFSSIFAPLSVLFNFYRVQELNLAWQFLALITDVITFYLCAHAGLDYIQTIQWYAIKQCVVYVIGFFALFFLITRRTDQQKLVDTSETVCLTDLPSV